MPVMSPGESPGEQQVLQTKRQRAAEVEAAVSLCPRCGVGPVPSPSCEIRDS